MSDNDCTDNYNSNHDNYEHLEHLKELAQRTEAENEVNRDIEEWKKQPPHPKRTRVIVKLINNTSIPLKVMQAGWNMSDSDRESLDVDPHGFTAFKWEFAFTKPGPASPSDKVQFKQFISFGNEITHFRFDTGLELKSSFGVFFSNVHTEVDTFRRFYRRDQGQVLVGNNGTTD